MDHLRYADGIALTSDSRDQLQEILDKATVGSAKMG